MQTGTCKVRQSLTDTEEHAVILLTFLVDWDNWPAGIHWLGIRHVTYVVAGDGNPHRIRAEVGARARDSLSPERAGEGFYITTVKDSLRHSSPPLITSHSAHALLAGKVRQYNGMQTVRRIRSNPRHRPCVHAPVQLML